MRLSIIYMLNSCIILLFISSIHVSTANTTGIYYSKLLKSGDAHTWIVEEFRKNNNSVNYNRIENGYLSEEGKLTIDILQDHEGVNFMDVSTVDKMKYRKLTIFGNNNDSYSDPDNNLAITIEWTVQDGTFGTVIPLLVPVRYVDNGKNVSFIEHYNQYGVFGYRYTEENADIIRSSSDSDSQVIEVIDKETGLLNFFYFRYIEGNEEKMLVQVKREEYKGTNTIAPGLKSAETNFPDFTIIFSIISIILLYKRKNV
ncbi:MAG: hypothetical protein ACXAD7_09980 [Candidatus Kariarchaeaceae archaeon]|jgi:hypothetical protein